MDNEILKEFIAITSHNRQLSDYQIILLDKLLESEVQRVEYKAELDSLRHRYMRTAGIMHVRGAFEEMLCVCSTSIQKAFGLHSWQSKRPSKEEQFGVIVSQNLKEFKTKLLSRKKNLSQLSDFQLKEWTVAIAGEVFSKESRLIHLSADEEEIEIDKKTFTADQIVFIQSICDSLGINTIVSLVDY